MSLESFISIYGYPALLLGTFLEGETILVIAGFLAHRGYLALPWVMVVALLGTFGGDQLYFWIGRTKGSSWLQRKQHWQERVVKVRLLLEKYHTLLIIGFRFFYGLRTVTPFAIGMSGFDPRRFIALNLVGALVWAVTVGAGGYLFGNALEIVLGDIKRYEYHVLTVMVVAGLAIWLIRFFRRRMHQSAASVVSPS